MRRVIYIGGAARSGSTLLSEMLGSQPKVLSVGELSLFWRDAGRSGRCACGSAIQECEFWGVVLKNLLHSHDVQPGEYLRLAATRASLAGTKDLRRLLTIRKHPELMTTGERRLVEVTAGLMEGALAESHSEVLVDSSKTLPSLLFHELCGGGTDLHLLHLIRDPRSVVASTVRSRGVLPGNAESLPPGGSALTGMARWAWANAAFAVGTVTRPGRMLVSYEQLVRDPPNVIKTICRFTGIDFDERTISGDELRLPCASHAAVGNPNRGAVTRKLRDDDRWRAELPQATRALVSVASWPVSAALRTIARYETVEQ
jgi:hypothetical protein